MRIIFTYTLILSCWTAPQVFAAEASSNLQVETEKVEQRVHALQKQNTNDRERLAKVERLIQQLRAQNQQLDEQLKPDSSE